MECKKLIRLSNGITKKMTCTEVFDQFKNFLYKIAHKWSFQYDINDLVQVAGIGLVKAYNTYDASKGILFMTYLATIVSNEIRMYNRKNKKHTGIRSLDCAINEDKDGNSLTIMDLISDDTDYEEMAIQNVNKLELSILLKCLRPREEMIIRYRFIDGLTHKKIGQRLNLSQSYVSRLTESSLKKLKRYYESGVLNVNVKNNTREDCFRYFSENDNKDKNILIDDVVNKYGCTQGTAESYYYRWKSEYAKPKTESKDGINSIQKSTYEKVKDFKPKGGILQPMELRGKIMCYNLYDNGNGFNMKRPNGTTVMPIEFLEIQDLIRELQEISKVGRA